MRLVYAAPVPYASFAQRSHRFVEFFNECGGGRTLWIDPYPGRLPGPTDFGRGRQRRYPRADAAVEVMLPAVLGVDPVMSVPLFRRLVWKPALKYIDAFTAGADWLLVIGRPSFLALHLLANTAPLASCYDAMDDFPEFYGGFSRWLSQRIESRIAGGVDAILVSSRTLQDKFARQGFNTELVRNGLAPPQELAWKTVGSSGRGQPVFGYVGTIGAWFDWALLGEMARKLPEVRFDLVGPVMTPTPRGLPANVRLRGECASEDVPSTLCGFTAGLIPFKVNRLTAAVDPIKYYEYRAAGLPVISTGFGDMADRGAEQDVYLVDQGTDFQSLLGAIRERLCVSCAELDRFRVKHAWRSRFERSQFFNAQVLKAGVR